jgi:hypothetical protein
MYVQFLILTLILVKVNILRYGSCERPLTKYSCDALVTVGVITLVPGS